MAVEQPDRAKTYAVLKRRLWLIETVFTLVFLWGFVVTGLAQWLSSWIVNLVPYTLFQVALFAGILSGLMTLICFPLDWYGSFALEHRFGLSTQRFWGWLWEYAKRLMVGSALGLILVEGLVLLLRRTPETWWIWTTAAWLGWSVLLTRAAPQLLIPIFYRQKALEDQALRKRLEKLLDRCGTRVNGLFEVNLSKTTRKANACLCGLGASRRVLVSDTLVSTYPPEEIEVVIAHEAGHHRLHHLGFLILSSSVAMGLSGWAVDQLIRQWMTPLGIMGLDDLAVLPMVGWGLFSAGLVLMPLTNGFSRWMEAQADRFALEKTRNPKAFVSTMRRLAQQNLAELTPPRWAVWLLYDHPPIAERIAMAERTAASHAG